MKERIYVTSNGETVVFCEKSWRYYIKNNVGQRMFLILTKDEHCGRGEYSEELQVFANGVAQAKRIAQAVIDKDMVPGLRISRVIHQGRK